jgi:hypothetical protein
MKNLKYFIIILLISPLITLAKNHKGNFTTRNNDNVCKSKVQNKDIIELNISQEILDAAKNSNNDTDVILGHSSKIVATTIIYDSNWNVIATRNKELTLEE